LVKTYTGRRTLLVASSVRRDRDAVLRPEALVPLLPLLLLVNCCGHPVGEEEEEREAETRDQRGVARETKMHLHPFPCWSWST